MHEHLEVLNSGPLLLVVITQIATFATTEDTEDGYKPGCYREA